MCTDEQMYLHAQTSHSPALVMALSPGDTDGGRVCCTLSFLLQKWFCNLAFIPPTCKPLSLCLLQACVARKICACADCIKKQTTLCKTAASVPIRTQAGCCGVPWFPRSLQPWCCAGCAVQSTQVLPQNRGVRALQLPDSAFLCARQ